MLTVLIVDDDALFRRVTRRMLRGVSNLECLEASGVEDATALLRERKPTVLLTDLQLGDGAGVDLLEALPGLSLRTLPILMSGVASLRDYQTALRLGAIDVLIKPFRREDLFSALQRALDSATGFRGVVHGLLLTDLLQMFHLARRSLVLEVRGPLFRGEVVFRHGEIVHAAVAEQQGLEALQTLLTLPSGTIHTHPIQVTPQTIDGSFQGVLMDAFREVDEAHRDAPRMISTLPPSELITVPAGAEVVDAPPSLSAPGAAHDGLRAFLRQLDPQLGAALLEDGALRVLLEEGNLEQGAWGPLGRLSSEAMARCGLHWDLLEWISSNVGLAIVRGGNLGGDLLLAQRFSGRLDDRRFRWSARRVERFLHEVESSKG